MTDLNNLRKTEWCPMFEKLMRNRLLMGALRYGPFINKIFGRPKWRLVDSIRTRLDKYERDHNLEHLVDIANLCMIEFVNPSSRRATLKPVDDGEHVERK